MRLKLAFDMKLAMMILAMIVALIPLASRVARANDEISPDLIRTVELEWEPLEKATEYEFQFGLSPDFEKPLYEQKTKDTTFKVDVLPGTYYYRVRATDGKGRDGKWSAIHDLNINARPPILLYPENEFVLQGNLPDTGIPLEWRTSGPSIRYLVEIKGEDETGQFTKTIVKQESDRTILPFFPQTPGRYQWSVHTIGAAGDEPGVPFIFTVEGVFPLDAPVEAGITPKRIVRYVSPWWRNHWTLWLRYGQTTVDYKIIDQDLRANSAFNGFDGFTDATLNWEWHDPVNWTFGGIPWIEGELELDRETVLSESVILSRKYLRVGSWYAKILHGWRFSPTFEYGSRDIAIYQPRSTIEAVRSTSTRQDLGVGLDAEYSVKQFFQLGAGFKLHFMNGGEAGFIPTPGTGDQFNPDSLRAGELGPSTGVEFDGTGTLALSSRMKVQGRIRYESFTATWVPHYPISPQTVDPSGLTSFSEQNLSFDISFGYHF